MSYFKIGENDYSSYVCELKVKTNANYNAQTNAAGNTIVDYINSKREIEVGIIPLTDAAMALEEGVNCIIPSNEVEYYTIQSGNTTFKQFNFSLIEL